jgi:hypothetical protein
VIFVDDDVVTGDDILSVLASAVEPELSPNDLRKASSKHVKLTEQAQELHDSYVWLGSSTCRKGLDDKRSSERISRMNQSER